jgi:phospholipid transport system substrate-binding protein
MTSRFPQVLLALCFASALLPDVVGAAPAVATPAAAGAASIPVAQDPQQQMTELANRLVKELDAQRPALKKDPARVYALVDSLLTPNFDLEYAGRLVLGTHYRTATPEQRSRFIRSLYRSLLKTYGAAVLDFTADRMKFLPFRPDASPDTATVRSEIRRDDGTRVPVNYVMRRTPDGWKTWDVVIEGISYVRNFRKDLGLEIQQRGLDAVIARLEAEAAGMEAKRRK